VCISLTICQKHCNNNRDNRPTLRPPGSGSESGRLGNWAAAVAVAVAVEVAGAGAQPKTERTDKPLNAVQKGAGCGVK